MTTLVEQDVYAGIPPGAAALYKQLKFEPTGPEQRTILASRKRKIGLSGGEGAGKSVIGSKIWLGRWPDDMAANPTYGDGTGDPLLYWLVGEDYSQVEAEFHYIEMDLLELGYPVDATNIVDPGHIKLHLPKERNPRLLIETKSARDPTRLTRQRPHGILHCEPGLSTVATYERLNGRIAGVRGWLALVGTLEGSMGYYPQLLQAWAVDNDRDEQSFRLPSWTNTHYYPGGRQDPEILRLERESSDQYFMERIGGEVVPPRGLVISEFRADLHVRDVQWDPDYPVYMCEDPGYGSQSAHALPVYQNINHQIRVFDEIYERGITTQEMIRLAQRRDWWKAPKKQLVCDPHYKDQHHATHSVSEIWRYSDAGIYPEDNERVPIGPGIERLKGYFKPDHTGAPGIIIAPHLQGLLSELGAALDPFDSKSYHPWKWKEDRFGDPVGMEPLDLYNHSCKALIYSIVHNFGYAHAQERRVGQVTRRNKSSPSSNPLNPTGPQTQDADLTTVVRRR